MIETYNNYFRIIAYALISISCIFSIKHHGCSKWILYGLLIFSVISGVLMLLNLHFGKPYIVQYLHTANVFTLAIFYWIHFLTLTPNGNCKKDRKKTR